MNKKDLSERDICTKYITPAIASAGWDVNTQIRENVHLTAGRVIVRGRMTARGKAKFADYVLYYKPNIPLAIVEGKANNHGVVDGIQQGLGYPYLRVENVQRGRRDLDRLERFELAPGELERWCLEKGDLLVVEGNGSERASGRCAMWRGEIEDCVHQSHIIRCRSRGVLTPSFTLLFLNSPTGMAEMKSLAITTSGLFSLSVGRIRGIDVPVPPPEEQPAIVAKVERLLKFCDELETRLRRAKDCAAKLAQAAVQEALA